jgi:hypothetical protein
LFQGAKTGKDNGYTVLLDIESFDYEFFKEGSEGMKVALVHHLVSYLHIHMYSLLVVGRVARLYFSKPTFQIWVNFGGS